MCVIAGYMGRGNAAPVLLEMLRREEGLAGGYYSGIATVHEGVLHYEKVVGDVETLIRETRALDLPGSIGIAHSRTPGGGGREWGHPFTDSDGKMAYIANGAVGLYKGRVDYHSEALRLEGHGCRFRSVRDEPIGAHPVLPDGRGVHMSDFMCQSVAVDYAVLPEGPERLLEAAMSGFQRLPSSIVGLFLHAERPDEIVAARHNKPLELGRLEDGSIVITSAALAFPKGVISRFRMPALCGGRFQRDGTMTLRPFTRPDLLRLGESPSAAAQEEVVRRLLGAGKSVSVREFVDALVALWDPEQLNEKEVIGFELLYALVREGRVKLREERVPGMDGKGTVPQTHVDPLRI